MKEDIIMYVICYYDKKTQTNTWELISGEDAMQIYISELYDAGLEADDIMVFDIEEQIK